MHNSDVNKSQVRYEYLDVARGISILLIVLGHTGFIGEFWLNFIYYINVPIFFILTGILAEIRDLRALDTKGMKNFLVKRFENLMIPYAAFSVIYSIIYFVQMKMGYMTGEDFLKNIRRALDFYGESVLWFLPTLFLAQAGFLVVGKLVRGLMLLWVSLLLGLSAAFSYRAIPEQGFGIGPAGDVLLDIFVLILRSLVALSFVAIGAFGYKYIISRIKAEKVLSRLLFWAAGIGFLLLAVLITGFGSKVDLRDMKLGKILIYYLQGITGSAGILSISVSIRKFAPLSFFGRNSVTVMCTHLDCYVMYGAIQLAWIVDSVVTRAKSYVFNLVIMITVILAEIIIIYLVNTFLPFLVGKRYKKLKSKSQK